MLKFDSRGHLSPNRNIPSSLDELYKEFVVNISTPERKSLENYNVDGYIVKTYPRENRKVALYMGDWTYWMDRFDKTRRNKFGNRYPKGFLEINY